MGLDGCYVCMKYLVVIFNLIFWVSCPFCVVRMDMEWKVRAKTFSPNLISEADGCHVLWGGCFCAVGEEGGGVMWSSNGIVMPLSACTCPFLHRALFLSFECSRELFHFALGALFPFVQCCEVLLCICSFIRVYDNVWDIFLKYQNMYLKKNYVFVFTETKF